MEGLEGLKILSQVTESYGIAKSIVCVICIALIIVCLVFMFVAIFEWSDLTALLLLFPIIALVGLAGSASDIQDTSTVIQVTPIEDKYYIDLNKYDVVSTEGEIITLEVKEVK